jgi:hypothetical protein
LLFRSGQAEMELLTAAIVAAPITFDNALAIRAAFSAIRSGLVKVYSIHER